MIVSPAHCNFFSVASSKGKNPSSSCSLEVQVHPQQNESFYQCPCHPNNNYHICSSSDNDKKWNLRCTKSKACLPENDKCYKCDLKSTQNTFCYVSQVTKGQQPPKCSYRPPKARNLVGITKKGNNNPKQSTNFDFCKLLCC